MATTTITQVTDDLDGSRAAATVVFGLDGKNYEIDLSKKNRAALDRALKPYLDAARPAPTRRRGPSDSRRRRARRGSELADIRAWAMANGHHVAERGRIPQRIQDAYHKEWANPHLKSS
jgi:hypothetical protein